MFRLCSAATSRPKSATSIIRNLFFFSNSASVSSSSISSSIFESVQTSSQSPPTTPPTAPTNSVSEVSMKHSEGILKERKLMFQEHMELHEKSLRKRGIDVNAKKDLELDALVDEAEDEIGKEINRFATTTASTSSSSQTKTTTTTSSSSPSSSSSAASNSSSAGLLSLKMKISKPNEVKKQNQEQKKKDDNNAADDSRIEVKPNQPVTEALADAIAQGLEAEKLRKQQLKEQQVQQQQQQQQQQDSSSSSGSSNNTSTNSSRAPKTPPLPAATPPLPSPSSSSSSSSTGTNILNPTDNDICYHLRGVIERSASRVSADITTLQLSLTKPMMDTLASRHSNSLRVFLSKFPARFRGDVNSPSRIHLVGVPGGATPSSSPSSSPSPNFSLHSSSSSSPTSSSSHPPVRPLHPSQIRNSPSSSTPSAATSSASSSSSSSSKQAVTNSSSSSKKLSPGLAAPALPPLPRNRSGAGGGEGGGGGGETMSMMAQQQQRLMETAFLSKSWKSPAEIVETLMEYIPSYWIPMRHVHNQLPFEIKELYQNKMRLNQFLRKFSYYFDSKMSQRGAEIKVRDDCKHPKKGNADDRYANFQRKNQERSEQQQQQHVSASSSSSSNANNNNNNVVGGVLSPPKHYMDVDTHSLAGQLKQLCSNTTFMNLKEFQNSLPGTITSHPDYDSTTGVLPTLEKHPFIFQVADGSVRLRQTGVAPNALDSKGKTLSDSPLPGVFAKVVSCLPTSTDHVVDVATILAKLTHDERDSIKKQFRSLPRFLRIHGAALEVSRDNTNVRRFKEPSSSSSAGSSSGSRRSSMLDFIDDSDLPPPAADEVDPTEPQQISDGAMALPKASALATATTTQVALKELYSSLPLSTCVVLEEAVSMLPSHMRQSNATVQDLDALAEEMEKYPDYFQVWQNPDDQLLEEEENEDDEDEDEAGEEENDQEGEKKKKQQQKKKEKKKSYVVQRTMVGGTPEIEMEQVAQTASSLIPQGGIDIEKLMRRMPPKIQRFLFRHGIKTTLKSRSNEFFIHGDKVLYIAVRD